jgi:hemolysin activation/secretion protein
LVGDGYVNSRVYAEASPAPGHLEVIEGRIVELRVNSNDPRLAGRVQRLLRPLQGQVLFLPSVQQQLELLKRLPGVMEVKGNLTRLGSDPTQAVFTVSVQPSRQPWQGEVSVRNDGSNGSGEFRSTGVLVKNALATPGDTLLLYGELNADDSPSLGSVITSLSYTVPISDQFSFTGSFGCSRRNLIELPAPADGLASNQFQGFGQFDYVFRESLSQRWSVSAAFSGNRSNTVLDGQATALGARLSGSWGFAPRWQLNLRAGGQVAFTPPPPRCSSAWAPMWGSAVCRAS